MSRCRVACWSELPSELLLKIADDLGSQLNIQPLRQVCKTWSRSIPLSYITSKNILSPLFPHEFKVLVHLFGENKYMARRLVVACSVFLFQSTLEPDLPPWLFTSEEFNRGKLLVSHSLSPIALNNLPPTFPRTVDFSHIRVSQLAAFHRIRDPDDGNLTIAPSNKVYCLLLLFVRPSKKNCPTIGDCTAVVLSQNGTIFTTRLEDGTYSKDCLGCSVRQKCVKSSQKSVKYKTIEVTTFDDIAVFKEKLYALDHRCRVYTTDYDTLSLTVYIEEPLLANGSDKKRRRLAVSNDGRELYLIYGYKSSLSHELSFSVYKLNEGQKKWDRVDGIGNDKILFVTLDVCFFASVEDVPGWKGNCIVFCRGDTHLIYYLNATSSSTQLWPPPNWISSHSCSLEREIKVDGKFQDGGKSDCSTIKFEGVDISSKSAMTLHKIWYMHGNLIKKSTIRTSDMLVQALELLATMVHILEKTSARCLSDFLVDYLDSNLTVLRRMGIRVDWLAPSVKKAIQLHKNKPRIELMYHQAEIAELRSKLNEKIAKLDELENRVMGNEENFTPFSENVDLDQPVGWDGPDLWCI